jgi:hypothetical protein
LYARHYTIIVRGRLGDRFDNAFLGASLKPSDGETRLDTGPLDQSQLHGLLEQLRNFAIELISVEETKEPDGHEPETPDATPNEATSLTRRN